jgi:hypothetical protein
MRMEEVATGGISEIVLKAKAFKGYGSQAEGDDCRRLGSYRGYR